MDILYAKQNIISNDFLIEFPFSKKVNPKRHFLK